jgi:ABC-type uncharacterized transport system substrate-binding protein
LAALRQGLADFGYLEGQNIVLEMRFPAEQYDRFFALAVELAQQNPDLLVSAAGIAAIACHRATTTIPIVSVNVPDPVGRKLVASLNRPGGNLTGLSNMAVELTSKRIELAKEMIKVMKSVRTRILEKWMPPVVGLAWRLYRLKRGTSVRWKLRSQRSVQTSSKRCP